jgi:predicted Zn-dependent protease
LQQGVASYQNQQLADAELCFKKMLHHNPQHAAANYMVGLVYCSAGLIKEAIPLLEKALDKCPWQHEWRQNLSRAYKETGQLDKAEQCLNQQQATTEPHDDDAEWQQNLTEAVLQYE